MSRQLNTQKLRRCLLSTVIVLAGLNEVGAKTFRGIVKDAKTHSPVIGTVIKVKGSKEGIVLPYLLG